MVSINVSMPQAMREFVKRRVRSGKYGTPTEYIRWLIREDEKIAERESLEKLLHEGLKSGKPVKADDAFWLERIARLKPRRAKRAS